MLFALSFLLNIATHFTVYGLQKVVAITLVRNSVIGKERHNASKNRIQIKLNLPFISCRNILCSTELIELT